MSKERIKMVVSRPSSIQATSSAQNTSPSKNSTDIIDMCGPIQWKMSSRSGKYLRLI